MPTTRIDPISILGASTSTETIQPGTLRFTHTPAVTLNPDLFRFAEHTKPTLDLAVGATPPGHRDGGYPLTLHGAEVVELRGQAPGFGKLTHAIEFPGSARLKSDDTLRGHTSFAVEMAIFPQASTEPRQNLIEAQKPGFSLSLRKVRGGYVLEAGLHVSHQPSTSTKTQWVSARSTRAISLGKWQRVGVMFDGNALMVTINGEVAGRRVLRDGRMAALRSGNDTWFLGTWVDGARNPFSGKIGGLKVWNSLPVQLMVPAQAAAAAGVGAIDSRHADLGGTRGLLRSPAEGQVDVEGGLKRRYQGGTLFWSARTGAHEVHGSILQRYRGHISRLGFPTTDEKDGKKSGSRVNGFENGVVLWHPSTGAHAVWGQAYMTYAANGAEGGWLGMPVGAVVVADARHTPETRFENGRIFQRRVNEDAFEVHGAILARYLELGGRHGSLGFPTSHESSVFNAAGAVIGKVSHFEHGSIYWSSGRGAHEVVAPLQTAYEKQGGPSGTLGFPVSNPKRHGQKHRQGFAGGVLMKRSPSAAAQIVTSLTLRLGRTTQVGNIDDGIGFFEKDKSAELFGKVNISASGVPKVQNKRVPNGHAGTTLTYSGAIPDVTIPATVDASFTVTIHLWDWDAASGDDKLGSYHRVFSADDLWELDASGSRVVDEPMTQGSGDASRSDLITLVSLASDKKEVDIADFRAQGWWKFQNKKTGNMSRGHYTEAFSDVEFVDDGWGAFIHLWDTIWYEAAFKGVASGGNCYGMCVEGHRALRNVSPFIQHIWERYDGFPDSNATLTRQINIKQGWQLGAPALRWTIWNILNGDMWQPKQVFVDAMRAIDRDRGCTMSFFSLEEFVGHAIFAYDYVDRRNQPGNVFGELLCADPNTPAAAANEGHKTKIIIFDNGTFRTEGVSTRTFPGGFSSTSTLGGHIPTMFMFHMPWHTYSGQPRTPFWEIMGLLVSIGGLILLAGDAETEDVTVGGTSIFTSDSGSRHMRRNAPISALPLVQAGNGLRAFGARDPLTKPLLLSLRGIGTGHWRQGGAIGAGALFDVKMPVKTGERDQLHISGFDGRAPQLRLDTTVTQKRAEVSYGIRDVAAGREARRFSLELSTAKDDAGTIQVDPHGGDLLVSPGGTAQPTDILVSIDTDRGTRQGLLRGVQPGTGTEVLRIRPDSWTNPRGTFTVEKLTGVGGTVLDRQRLDGQRP